MIYDIYAVGNTLRSIRNKYGYTQNDMAESLDVSYGCVEYPKYYENHRFRSREKSFYAFRLFGSSGNRNC